MSLTIDPNHPDLTRYTGPEEPAPQAKVYLVLSEEERAKGFVRPLRRSYVHVGCPKPKYTLIDVDPEERPNSLWIKYEKYPEGSPEAERGSIGKYWTRKELDDKGCGTTTTMGLALCETYACNPHFYGATYCCGCSKHLPVEEFVWTEDGAVVGS